MITIEEHFSIIQKLLVPGFERNIGILAPDMILMKTPGIRARSLAEMTAETIRVMVLLVGGQPAARGWSEHITIPAGRSASSRGVGCYCPLGLAVGGGVTAGAGVTL